MRKVLVAIVGVLLLVQGAIAEPLGGGLCRQGTVGSYDEHELVLALRGGEATLIAVSGDPGADLDLFVYDEFGQLIGSDIGASDECFVVLDLLWTARYTIRIVNRSPVSSEFTICVL